MRPTASRRAFGVALLVPLLTFLTPAPVVLPALAGADAAAGDPLAPDRTPGLPPDIPSLYGGPYEDGLADDGLAHDDGLTYDDAFHDDGTGYDEALYGEGFDQGYDNGYVDSTLPDTGNPPPADTGSAGYDQGYRDGYDAGLQAGPGGGNVTGNGTGTGDTDGNTDEDRPTPPPGTPPPGTPPPVLPPPGPYVPPEGPVGDDRMPGITVQGDSIVRDGERWWLAGYNSFVWSGDCGDPEERMSAEEVDAWFASMRRDGHGAARLFFFEGWDIGRLDAAVASARRWNVYLTITLDDAVGGCGETGKTAAWFADPAETAAYERHLRMLLERYRGETAIAWFEFFNEPDWEGGALRAFYDRMGAVADAVDPSRLFSSGTVAPYWVGGEANFRSIHSSPGVDIASLHEYDADEVESNHGPRVRANSAGKPVVAGEFGIHAGPGDCSGAVQAGERGVRSYTERAQRFRAKLDAYTGPGYAGGFGWAWQPGRSGCEFGNLDQDQVTQDVFRAFRAGEPAPAAAAAVPDPAAATPPPTTAPAGTPPARPRGPSGTGTPAPSATPTP